jgi:glycosyltransferase involved in cell wall biosynthesis
MEEQTSFDSKLDDVEISLPGNQEMPESYILYHGPTTQEELYHLFDAWRWASGAIGEYYPLLVIGIPNSKIPGMETWIEKLGFGGTVGLAPPLSAKALAALYRGCSALFHPAHISPWSIPLRLGLAYARPIVAQETPWSDAIVGPAAYLVAPGDDGYANSRALGAALTTVIVEESLADELSQAARQRTAKWDGAAFADELDRAYLKVLEG